MRLTISVTEAVRNFSDVINRVYYQGHSYLLTRGGVVVARLSAPDKPFTGAEWLRRWPARPRLDAADAASWEDELVASKSEVGPPAESSWGS